MKVSVYKHYLLGILLLITAHNFVDRIALGLLLQSIKVDLALSDTQLGLLTGIAFALFFSLMGIPIARWGDRGNRVLIITLTTALWSAAVILCGMARSFGQLLLTRIGVAVGEAGCLPTTHSLIADYFTRAERPRAVAVYMLGPPLGMLIGYLPAGWLNDLYGWRVTFMLLGLPGLVLAALAWLILKEPRCTKSTMEIGARRDATASSQGMAALAAAQPSLREVSADLWDNQTFRHLLVCMSVSSFFGYGILQWQPTFFIRSFGLPTGEVGTWFALIYGLGGAVGIYFGGVLASRYAARDERLQLKVAAFSYVTFAALSACVYLSTNRYLAFGILAVAAIGGGIMTGPLFAIMQLVVRDRVRATAIALVYLFVNLIGMGLGPLAAGALSDAFMLWAAGESLRYALLILCPGYLLCAWYLLKASTTVSCDLEAVEANA